MYRSLQRELESIVNDSGIVNNSDSESDSESEGDSGGDGLDIAVSFFLSRPCVWINDLVGTMDWYLRSFGALMSGQHRWRALELLFATCYGLGAACYERGAAVGSPDIPRTIGGVLAMTLLDINAPEIVPRLLATSRHVSYQLDPAGRQDPLEPAVHFLLDMLESSVSAQQAARTVTKIFSKAEDDVRHDVVSVVLSDRGKQLSSILHQPR